MMEIPSDILSSYIRRGAILHSDMFEDISHGKFFVIIGVTENRVAGFFFINSGINHAILNKPEQLSMQYLMKQSEYPFLRYDSFLCATNLTTRSIDYIVNQIKQGKAKFIGEMKEEHLNELLNKARESRLFSPTNKKQFFY